MDMHMMQALNPHRPPIEPPAPCDAPADILAGATLREIMPTPLAQAAPICGAPVLATLADDRLVQAVRVGPDVGWQSSDGMPLTGVVGWASFPWKA
jgi:hypothetical protein